MYKITLEEKQSMHKLFGTFVMMGRCPSGRILQRIDEGKLNKRDLGSVSKKLVLAIQR